MKRLTRKLFTLVVLCAALTSVASATVDEVSSAFAFSLFY
jgi:hypothetical protein